MAIKPATALAFGAGLVLLAAVVIFAAIKPGDDTGPLVLTPDKPEIVAQGRLIYVDKCAACHGANLEGQPNWKRQNSQGRLPAPPHDQTGHTWHHADALLIGLTKYGLKKYVGGDYKSDMPVYDGVLSDTEIIAVLSFIKSTWPARTRARHDAINASYSSQNPPE